ncbi:MAG: carboxylating nicotinate-nucleotide diphosphorylase [Geodermatophilaceae bacterium]|nr:carboxylating nicotinate-nucleotide diphosphorylase [Geodermatophilaceae bacterium]
MTLSPRTVEALTLAGLDPVEVEALCIRTLAEDLAGGVDVTSAATIAADLVGTAAFVPRQDGVVAGIAVAMACFDVTGPVTWGHVGNDGPVVKGTTVLEVTGPVRTLLTAERSALNLLCHLSGVATLTASWVEAVAGTSAQIRDTRKTTPGLRALEKAAVVTGGGRNHRMSLSDAALIKDNHVVAAGGVVPAFEAVRAQWPDLEVEVECDSVAQVREVVAAGADLVLLDNMSLDDLRASVAICRPASVRTEASGGLTLDRARAVAETGVDFISVGALTHSAPVLDLGLDLQGVRDAAHG